MLGISVYASVITLNQRLKNSLHHSRLYELLGRYLVSARGRFFDLRHGVSTSGGVLLRNLDIEGTNVAFGHNYLGMDPRFFKVILDSLAIRHEDFVFVDFGSGKGRAILLASEYPFKKVVGVEFSPVLHQIAQDNIRRYISSSKKCEDVESVCMDAVDYPIPDDPVVLLFYNPFGEEVMAPVLANIRKSMKKNPREIFVIYVYPLFNHLMDNNDALTRVGSGAWHSIYKCI